ncbi:MAG: hypothetical protein H7835_02795 [Magnetococcus sp. XQGC-1]
MGPKGVDPSPGVKNAPLLRPVAVCARVGTSVVLWLRVCGVAQVVAGGAARQVANVPVSRGEKLADFADCRGRFAGWPVCCGGGVWQVA